MIWLSFLLLQLVSASDPHLSLAECEHVQTVVSVNAPAQTYVNLLELRLKFSAWTLSTFSDVRMEENGMLMMFRDDLKHHETAEIGHTGSDAIVFHVHHAILAGSRYYVDGLRAELALHIFMHRVPRRYQLSNLSIFPGDVEFMTLTFPISFAPVAILQTESTEVAQFLRALTQHTRNHSEKFLEAPQVKIDLRAETRFVGTRWGRPQGTLLFNRDVCARIIYGVMELPISSSSFSWPIDLSKEMTSPVLPANVYPAAVGEGTFPQVGHFTASELRARMIKFEFGFGSIIFALFLISVGLMWRRNAYPSPFAYVRSTLASACFGVAYKKYSREDLGVSSDEGEASWRMRRLLTQEQNDGLERKTDNKIVRSDAKAPTLAVRQAVWGVKRERSLSATFGPQLLWVRISGYLEKTGTLILFVAYPVVCILTFISGSIVASCYEGLPWESHVPVFVLYVVTRLWEMLLLHFLPEAKDGIVDTCCPLTQSFILKFFLGSMAFLDAYTDTTAIVIASQCNSILWAYMAVVFVVSVLILQWVLLPICALTFDSSRKCLFKLMHMDTLAAAVDLDPEDKYAERLWTAINWSRLVFEDIPQSILQSLFVYYVHKNLLMLISISLAVISSLNSAYNAAKTRIHYTSDLNETLDLALRLEEAIDTFRTTRVNKGLDDLIQKLTARGMPVSNELLLEGQECLSQYQQDKARFEAVKVGQMCDAASHGDVPQLRRLLGQKADASLGDYDNRTPIHLAASEGHTSAVKFLVENAANPNVKDRWGNTPLADAERLGFNDLANYLRTCE